MKTKAKNWPEVLEYAESIRDGRKVACEELRQAVERAPGYDPAALPIVEYKDFEAAVLAARLKLADTVRAVIANCLSLIGVAAPEKM